MIFPLGDENVKGGYKPIFSYTFLALNIIFFIYQIVSEPGMKRVCDFGAIPSKIMQGEDLFTLFTSMFSHGGIAHILGNMLFLWIFADNIEAIIGNTRFAVFYLIGGFAAHAGHIFLGLGPDSLGECCLICLFPHGGCDPCQGSIPTVGASGAIAAVMGAYLVMFPMSKIKMLVLILFRSFHIPAFVFLGGWIAMQFFNVLEPTSGAGVAWWAHIGGFAFGALCGWFFREKYLKNFDPDADYPVYL